MNCTIGIDIGTTSTIGVLLNTKSNKVLLQCSRSVELYSQKSGWAEEEPEEWWKNTISILQEIGKFSKNNCNVYGISKDSIESHKKFKKKYKIKFDLLSDEKKIAIKAYKVWGKKQFMGKEFMGLIRSSFLIKNKKIIKEWRSVRVKNHAQEVLNYILNK